MEGTLCDDNSNVWIMFVNDSFSEVQLLFSEICDEFMNMEYWYQGNCIVMINCDKENYLC